MFSTKKKMIIPAYKNFRLKEFKKSYFSLDFKDYYSNKALNYFTYNIRPRRFRKDIIYISFIKDKTYEKRSLNYLKYLASRNPSENYMLIIYNISINDFICYIQYDYNNNLEILLEEDKTCNQLQKYYFDLCLAEED